MIAAYTPYNSQSTLLCLALSVLSLHSSRPISSVILVTLFSAPQVADRVCTDAVRYTKACTDEDGRLSVFARIKSVNSPVPCRPHVPVRPPPRVCVCACVCLLRLAPCSWVLQPLGTGSAHSLAHSHTHPQPYSLHILSPWSNFNIHSSSGTAVD